MTRNDILPAIIRPSMYTGFQGQRTKEEWIADAVIAILDRSEPYIDMDTNRMIRVIPDAQTSVSSQEPS